MKNVGILLILACLIFPYQAISKADPCDCIDYQKRLTGYYLKGDLAAILNAKCEFRLKLVTDRLAIMQYYAGHKDVYAGKKAAISASVKELKAVKLQLEQTLREVRKIRDVSKEEMDILMHKIETRSGKALTNSSKVLYGTYHGDIPPLTIVKPGGGTNCDEGETPPDFDCMGAAQNVNDMCQDAIQDRMECGVYSEGDGESKLAQDQMECNTATENSRNACQRAIAMCDNAYDPNRDIYNFMRQASTDCQLKEINTRPAETQTNTGN